MRPVRAKALNIARSFKAFALTGRQVTAPNNPGRCPGLRASALSGRAACIHCSGLRAFGPSGRAACIHCPGLRASALSGRAACIHCPGLRASGPSARIAKLEQTVCSLGLLRKLSLPNLIRERKGKGIHLHLRSIRLHLRSIRIP